MFPRTTMKCVEFSWANLVSDAMEEGKETFNKPVGEYMAKEIALEESIIINALSPEYTLAIGEAIGSGL